MLQARLVAMRSQKKAEKEGDHARARLPSLPVEHGAFVQRPPWICRVDNLLLTAVPSTVVFGATLPVLGVRDTCANLGRRTDHGATSSSRLIARVFAQSTNWCSRELANGDSQRFTSMQDEAPMSPV